MNPGILFSKPQFVHTLVCLILISCWIATKLKSAFLLCISPEWAPDCIWYMLSFHNLDPCESFAETQTILMGTYMKLQ